MINGIKKIPALIIVCLLYTSPFATDDKLGRISSYQNAAGEYAAWLQEEQAPNLLGLKKMCIRDSL